MRFLKESTDIFNVGNTEVIKNPTDREYRELYNDIRKDLGSRYDYKTFEPLIRITYDDAGNEYIWDSRKSTHYSIENDIRKRFGVRVNQNKNFDLDESYLDKEEKFYDYGTDEVTSYNANNFFDTNRTGFSYYDNFLNDKDLQYMQKAKGLTGHIEEMSPRDYFKYSAQFFNMSPETLINKIKNDEEAMNNLREMASKYKRRLMLPYLNFSNNQQEGNHRMLLAAELLGWDTKLPVLCIYDY